MWWPDIVSHADRYEMNWPLTAPHKGCPESLLFELCGDENLFDFRLLRIVRLFVSDISVIASDARRVLMSSWMVWLLIDLWYINYYIRTNDSYCGAYDYELVILMQDFCEK